jgi:type VI secretion system protein ImpM
VNMVKNMARSLSRRISWYGKLPARGDFVGRGLPARWRNEWDGWLQAGIALAATHVDAATLRDRLGNFAPWRYVAHPMPGEFWCGIITASRDRVGRVFPMTLVERLDAPSSSEESAARLASLLDAIAEGPEALEAAIAALPPRPEKASGPTREWPPEPASLWWPLTAADDAVARPSAWPPEPALLLELLDLQPASHQIASAE